MENTLNNISDEFNAQLQNPAVSGTLNILLILYASIVAPDLPEFLRVFFSSVVGKIIIVALIALTASRNINVAVLIAVGFVITLNSLRTEEFSNNIAN
jgi:hypothetical protein